MDIARARGRLRRQARAFTYGVLSLTCLVLVGPLVADRVLGYVKHTGDCRLLRVVEGDVVRVTCDIIGKRSARIVGIETPVTRGAECYEEWRSGQDAKWALRRWMWMASEVEVQGELSLQDQLTVELVADGSALSLRLMELGMARPFGFQTDVPTWCSVAPS